MYLVHQKPGHYGAWDVLACKLCNGEMMLTRRSPDPSYGTNYEEQRFTCRECRHEATRIVDSSGNPPAGQSPLPHAK
jgi:hypothetical protein